jgi:acyl-CoA dehydrogenase
VCLLKNHATQTMQFCANAAVEMMGGMGYMRSTASERVTAK